MKILLQVGVFLCSSLTPAQEPQPMVDQAVTAAGGQEQLLRAFRVTELFNSGETALPENSPKRTPRTSPVQLPDRWVVNGTERGAEPARAVVRARTLDLLLDSKSQLEILREVADEDVTCDVLRVSGSVRPAMKLYFDRQTHLLKRVDWREDFFRFSGWETQDWLNFPARCVLFRTRTGKACFHHEITELERLPARAAKEESR